MHMYLISRALGSLFGNDLCNNIQALRATNLLFSVGMYLVIRRIISLLHPSTNTLSRDLFALALTWFPVLMFFNFVYYTDAGSTFFVLLCYMLVKQKQYTLAGLSGMISLTFRQTNIIWVAVFMALAIIDIVALNDPLLDTIQSFGTTMNVIQQLVIKTCYRLPEIVKRLFFFCLALVGFMAFLIWNQGIVLGDRANHVAGLHFPQLFYFSSFLSFFASPWILTSGAIKTFMQPNLARCLLCMGAACIMLYLIRHYTYEHPFLLSDNRHYTFYIWRKIYRRHWSVRFLAVPLYIISGWFNLHAIARRTTLLVVMGYLAGIVATLVPSPLLEFRYFIIPFLFYCLQLGPPQQQWRTWIALLVYAILHLVTIYLFVYRPFVWQHEPDQIQRFMW